MGREQDVLDYVTANAPAGDAEAVIAAADKYVADGHSMMNLGPGKSRHLEEAIDAVGAKRILELGSFFGYSATRMAHRVGADGSLITVDADKSRHDVSGRFIAHAGMAGRVQLILGRAEDVIPKLDGVFDLVFIDHYGEHYLQDLQAIEAHGLIRAGTAVVTDNVITHRPTIDSYLDYIRDGGGYRSTLLEVGRDGIEVSIRLGD